MRAKWHWFWYYQITRRKQAFAPWMAHKLPKKLKYYVVIEGMATHTVQVDPHCHPDSVTGWQVLRTFE